MDYFMIFYDAYEDDVRLYTVTPEHNLQQQLPNKCV